MAPHSFWYRVQMQNALHHRRTISFNMFHDRRCLVHRRVLWYSLSGALLCDVFLCLSLASLCLYTLLFFLFLSSAFSLSQRLSFYFRHGHPRGHPANKSPGTNANPFRIRICKCSCRSAFPPLFPSLPTLASSCFLPGRTSKRGSSRTSTRATIGN